MAVTKFMEAGTAATQGFEFWTSLVTNVNTITSDAQAVAGSVRSIKCAHDGGANHYAYAHQSGVLADAGRRISFYMRWSALPTAGKTMDFFVPGPDNDSTNNWLVCLDSNGHLVIQNTSIVTQATGTTVLAINTDYRICITYTITSASVNTITVYLNGFSEVSATNIAVLTGGTGLDLGITDAQPTSTSPLNIFFSHIYVDDGTSGDTGDIHVTAKRPNANGTTNGFTTQIGSGGSGYGTGHSPQVNERPLNTADGWSMVGAGSAITEEYNVEAAATGDVSLTGATIRDYAGWVYASSLAGETASIIVGGATSNISLTSTNTLFEAYKGAASYPPGSGSDVGIVTTTALTTVSLYECGIIVAYIPGTGALTPDPSLLGVLDVFAYKNM